MYRAILLHLSVNLWEEKERPENRGRAAVRNYQPFLRVDDRVWKEVVTRFAEIGGNLLVLDTEDAIVYKSHPEIAVENAWSREKLRQELKFCRDLGLEVVPKLNFSCCHDVWMGEFSHMVSSRPYYNFCKDLIEETVELFDGPKLFHVGLDEEAAEYQRNMEYIVVRQGQQYYDDMHFYFDQVRKNGARPWMWADHIWFAGEEEFAANIPKDVIQSNWYYFQDFGPFSEADWQDPERSIWAMRVKGYEQLTNLGYDQIPTGSSYAFDDNFARTVDFCKQRIPAEHLLGFLQSSWESLEWKNRDFQLQTVEDMRNIQY